MRNFLILLLLSCTLSLSAQQKKTTTQKAKTTATTKAKTTSKSKASTTSSKKKTTKKSTSSSKKSVPTTKDIQKLQNEQAALQKKIAEAQDLLNTNRKDVKSQLANLALISGKIDQQQKYVRTIQSEVDTLTHNISILHCQLLQLQEDLAECKRKYSHGALYMYRNRLMSNKLMFIFSAKNFQQMYRRIRYAQEYTKYQRAQGRIIMKKEEEVAKKQEELKGTQAQKQTLLNEGKNQQTVLEGQKKERQTVVDNLNKQQKQLQNTIAEQKRKSQQLNAKIDQLIQIEIKKAEERRLAEEARQREKKRQEEQAAAKAKKESEAKNKKETASNTKKNSSSGNSKSNSKNTASETKSSSSSSSNFNAPDNTDRKLSSNFASNQGRLPVPITGSYVISAHFGSYTPDGLSGVTLDNKGINITGKSGAQARCVFDGEVSAVFTIGGLTNVIVRHGSYMSVYCNLSSSSVRQGQKVTARQTLGPVARDASGNVTLHFQLRKETAKLNPESWIGR